MIGLSSATGSNPLFGVNVEDISFKDGKTINFALIILLSAFVYAALTFRPFMAKNQSDTFLSLPIKKTQLLTFQILFGIVVIAISTFFAFGVFYPAMNLTRFTSIEYYYAALKSILTEILIPVVFYYLLSVILVLNTRNFLSSLFLLAGFSITSFLSSSYIISEVGLKAIGAELYEIIGSTQTFYFNAGLFIPTKFITTVLRILFNFGAASVNPVLLSTYTNIAIICIAFIVFVFTARSTLLGEFNRPLDFKSFLKVLPIALLIAVLPLMLTKASALVLYVTALIVAIAAFIIIYFLEKGKRSSIFVKTLACFILFLIPVSATLTDYPISKKVSFDVPELSNVEAVYFNPIYPTSAYDFYYNGEPRSQITSSRRYCFTSDEAIEKIIALHGVIVENIKKNELVGMELFEVEDNLTAAQTALEFREDDYFRYLNQINDENIAKEEESQWGLFDRDEIEFEYFSYLYNIDGVTEISPQNSLPVIGNDKYEGNEIEIPNYAATFYYKLTDGRWFKRIYRPLPIGWIKDSMVDVLSTKEYQEIGPVEYTGYQKLDSLGDINKVKLSVTDKKTNEIINVELSAMAAQYNYKDFSKNLILQVLQSIKEQSVEFSKEKLDNQKALYELRILGPKSNLVYNVSESNAKLIGIINQISTISKIDSLGELNDVTLELQNRQTNGINKCKLSELMNSNDRNTIKSAIVYITGLSNSPKTDNKHASYVLSFEGPNSKVSYNVTNTELSGIESIIISQSQTNSLGDLKNTKIEIINKTTNKVTTRNLSEIISNKQEQFSDQQTDDYTRIFIVELLSRLQQIAHRYGDEDILYEINVISPSTKLSFEISSAEQSAILIENFIGVS